MPLEQRKGQTSLRTENPDYPKNFLDEVFKELEKEKIVVSPFIEHVYNAIESEYFKQNGKDISVYLAFPNQNIFDEYEERFINRGNGTAFIDRRRKEFPSLVKLFENADSKKYVKLELQKGEYLSDILFSNNVALVSK